MTPEEARSKLMDIFPNSTVAASQGSWYHHRASGLVSSCSENFRLSYSFSNMLCSSQHGSSFEECFEKLAQETTEINAILAKDSILLRKFDFNAV